MIDKHKAETCQWNMLVKGVFLGETHYCHNIHAEPERRGKSSFQNLCSEKNRCPKNMDESREVVGSFKKKLSSNVSE